MEHNDKLLVDIANELVKEYNIRKIEDVTSKLKLTKDQAYLLILWSDYQYHRGVEKGITIGKAKIKKSLKDLLDI